MDDFQHARTIAVLLPRKSVCLILSGLAGKDLNGLLTVLAMAHRKLQFLLYHTQKTPPDPRIVSIVFVIHGAHTHVHEGRGEQPRGSTSASCTAPGCAGVCAVDLMK